MNSAAPVLAIVLLFFSIAIGSGQQHEGYPSEDNESAYDEDAYDESVYDEQAQDESAYSEYICLQCPECGTVYRLTPDEAASLDPNLLCPECSQALVIDFEEVACPEEGAEDLMLASLFLDSLATGLPLNKLDGQTSTAASYPEKNASLSDLIQNLSAEDSRVRADAARRLGDLEDPAVVDPLIRALQDKEANVRAETVESLRRIGDPKTVDSLITSLQDEDAYVRKNAAEALGKIGDKRAIDPLKKAQEEDASEDVRKAAEEAQTRLEAKA